MEEAVDNPKGLKLDKSNSRNDSVEFSEEQQNARSYLRERFLRALFAVYDKPASFSMHERTKVDATFRATDINLENFQVSQLQTPTGVVEEAELRSSDVLSFIVEVGVKDDTVNTR